VPARPTLLDLYCGQGGAGWGYHLAGFDVTGVDIRPQPRHPHDMRFIQGDAIDFLAAHGHEFDFIHASPVCRAYTRAIGPAKGRYNHPQQIPILRRFLMESGKPYVIENVEGAPLTDPITLCGAMFELPMYRHRLFEFGNMPRPPGPSHPTHRSPTAPMGRKPSCGQLWSVAGNFTGVREFSVAIGMPWADQEGLRQAIPPEYTRWVGTEVMTTIGV
jgi:DNA (cytosine-5)-methyltransferase 1